MSYLHFTVITPNCPNISEAASVRKDQQCVVHWTEHRDSGDEGQKLWGEELFDLRGGQRLGGLVFEVEVAPEKADPDNDQDHQ